MLGLLGVALVVVVLVLILVSYVRIRVAKVALPAGVANFVEGVRAKRIPVSRDSLLQMTVVNSAIPGTKAFLGEALSDEQTDAVSASLREIYEAQYGAVDVDVYEAFEDAAFDPCAGGVADPGYKFVYNAATNMCDQIPDAGAAAAVSTDCQEGKVWDAARAKCVWKKDSPWQRQADCENRGKFWDMDFVVDPATGASGKCMAVTPEREARKADPVYQAKRAQTAAEGEAAMLKAGKDPKVVAGSFQNQLIAAGFTTWKNGKLCNAAGECYAPWAKADQDRAVKGGIAKYGQVTVDPWTVDAKPIGGIINDTAGKMGYTQWAWYRSGKKGPATGMKCKPWPKGGDPVLADCKWMGAIAKEWGAVVASRKTVSSGAVDAALASTTGGLYPGAAQLGNVEWGWGKNKGKVCKKGQKECLTAAEVKTKFQQSVNLNIAKTGKAAGNGCSYPGAFELGYTRWGYPNEGGGNVCCNANGKCLNKGQIEKARANTAGSVSTRKYMCYKDGKPFESKNVDVNWAGGAGDAAWACNKNFPSCGGKCTADPNSAKVIVPAKSFCTWNGKDQTSAGWYKVGGNCCAKDSCTCRNMVSGGSFQTTDATHNGGKCAKKGAAPAKPAPAAAKPAPAAAAGGKCFWGGKDQSNGWVPVGKKCCSKNSCYCVDNGTGANGYNTTDKSHRAGACAAAKPAPGKPAPAKGPCNWGGKDQTGYVKVGNRCCQKFGCYCVDPTTGANGYTTQDKNHNSGKCANTLQNATNNAVAAIDARNKQAAADKAKADAAAAAAAAAKKAKDKANEQEKLRQRAEWN
jgi:hypothetical protein